MKVETRRVQHHADTVRVATAANVTTFMLMDDNLISAMADADESNAALQVETYYESVLRPANPNILPWEQLPESVRSEFSGNLASVIGRMFPDFTCDGSVSRALAALTGKDENDPDLEDPDLEDIDLPRG